MSQQGIFSIAPDSQPNGNSAGNASPFTAVTSNGVQDSSSQASPFATAEPSPFQQVRPDQETASRGGIPQPRPEGQPPAMKTAHGPGEPQIHEVDEAGQNAFESEPQQQSGGPFEMNGFPEQSAGQFTEAAPVAKSQQDSPFAVVNNDGADYEAAKAELEPQQDFAAVQPRFTPEPVPVPAEVQRPILKPVAHSEETISTAQVQPVVSQPAPAFQQLELRAIFGIDHTLDQQEIIQRARTLPGVRNVAVVGQQEASALSNFRQAMQNMGFGDSQDMKLTSGGGVVDFLTEGDTTIAVLHEGGYAPGVQETLIIVAREIGKLA